MSTRPKTSPFSSFLILGQSIGGGVLVQPLVTGNLPSSKIRNSDSYNGPWLWLWTAETALLNSSHKDRDSEFVQRPRLWICTQTVTRTLNSHIYYIHRLLWIRIQTATLNMYKDRDSKWYIIIYTYTATLILYTDRDFEVVQRQFSEVVPATVLWSCARDSYSWYQRQLLWSRTSHTYSGTRDSYTGRTSDSWTHTRDSYSWYQRQLLWSCTSDSWPRTRDSYSEFVPATAALKSYQPQLNSYQRQLLLVPATAALNSYQPQMNSYQKQLVLVPATASLGTSDS